MIVAIILLVLAVAGMVILYLKALAKQKRLLAHIDEISVMRNNERLAVHRLINMYYKLLTDEEALDLNVLRRIKGAQYADAVGALENKANAKRRITTFITEFDKAILTAFPAFYDGINALLQYDKRITPTDPGVLTPELRVLALTAIGVEQGEVIGKLLGLTPTSVYVYRNRVRGRALNRATFDDDVLRMAGDIGLT